MKKAIYPESASVYLPKGTKTRLQVAALDCGMTVSTFLRIAVLDWLKKKPGKRGQRAV